MIDHSDIAARAGKTAQRQIRAAKAVERKKRVERHAVEPTEAKPKKPVERLAFPFAEAAEAIGRDTSTLHRWVAKGLVHAVQIGGSHFITAAELARLLTEGAPKRGRKRRAAGGQFTKDADGGATR